MSKTDYLAPLTLTPAITKRRPVSDHIAESLRDAIRSGALADGTELNQVLLASHYGVSRVPIREALLQLHAEGWITLKLHQQAIVRGMSNDRIAEILEIRATLESSLIERAIESISAEIIERLEQCCTEMETTKDHAAWLAGNAEFHQLLYMGANRPATLELLAQLSSQVERYVRNQGRSLARQREAEREHRAILSAFKTQSVESARELMQEHIGLTLRRFRASTPPQNANEQASAS